MLVRINLHMFEGFGKNNERDVGVDRKSGSSHALLVTTDTRWKTRDVGGTLC